MRELVLGFSKREGRVLSVVHTCGNGQTNTIDSEIAGSHLQGRRPSPALRRRRGVQHQYRKEPLTMPGVWKNDEIF